MEKAVARGSWLVARGSWFVARKTPPLNKKGLWLNLTAALSDSQSTSQSALLTAPLSGEPLQPAICSLRTAFILRCAAGDDEARHAGGAFLCQRLRTGL